MGDFTRPLASAPRALAAAAGTAAQGITALARGAADGLGNLLADPLGKRRQPRNQPGPLWPRDGDTRIRAGETQVYWRGWQSRTAEDARTVAVTVPNPAWEKARKARQRGTR
ncbi:MAG TPA: hypothetical protein VKV80_15695 [Streptosporangiaceae bacterium]|nr:hypothetical protein [Streptosporangiaceae bacterium]